MSPAEGARLDAGLRRLRSEHDVISELRGTGLMRGLRLERCGPELNRSLYERGLIANCTAGDVVRLLPPYVVHDADIDQALEILDAALRTL
jgi:acetylornithine/N-succinyldiaminopimelate aminotransferase